MVLGHLKAPPLQSCPSISKVCESPQKCTKVYKVLQSTQWISKVFESIWMHVDPFGTICMRLDQFGSIWLKVTCREPIDGWQWILQAGPGLAPHLFGLVQGRQWWTSMGDYLRCFLGWVWWSRHWKPPNSWCHSVEIMLRIGRLIDVFLPGPQASLPWALTWKRFVQVHSCFAEICWSGWPGGVNVSLTWIRNCRCHRGIRRTLHRLTLLMPVRIQQEASEPEASRIIMNHPESRWTGRTQKVVEQKCNSHIALIFFNLDVTRWPSCDEKTAQPFHSFPDVGTCVHMYSIHIWN